MKYNIKQIKDLYYNQKLTLRQIAKIFDVCHVTILDFMEKNNLKRRNHTESQIGKKFPKEVKEKMFNCSSYRL